MKAAASYPESMATERLRLERFRPADEDAIVAVWAADDVWRWLRPGTPYDEAIARIGFDRHRRHWDEHGFGLWAVRESPDETVIGWVGASHPAYVPEVAAEVEIGWTLRPEFRGRGLAAEGARAACKAAFDSLGRRDVISLITRENLRSQAVATAIGMRMTRSVRHPTLGATLDVYELHTTSPRSR